jgi:hypothetical protein
MFSLVVDLGKAGVFERHYGFCDGGFDFEAVVLLSVIEGF